MEFFCALIGWERLVLGSTLWLIPITRFCYRFYHKFCIVELFFMPFQKVINSASRVIFGKPIENFRYNEQAWPYNVVNSNDRIAWIYEKRQYAEHRLGFCSIFCIVFFSVCLAPLNFIINTTYSLKFEQDFKKFNVFAHIKMVACFKFVFIGCTIFYSNFIK